MLRFKRVEDQSGCAPVLHDQPDMTTRARCLTAAIVSRACVGIALGAAACAPAQAKELGALVSITQGDGRVDITTQDGEVIQIEVFGGDVVRIRAGHGKLTDAGDKAAKIVIGTREANVRQSLSATPEYHLLQTDGFSLRIYRSPLRFEAYDAANRQPIWRELRPIDLRAEGTTQTLTLAADEQFFGGGQQNGSYAFRGKLMEVSYSGGWEEGDRPNPAPFYMSTAGYGVLRNSWTNAVYDFRSEGHLTATQAEDRFDAFYFFGDIRSVLADYTALTGRAHLLPRWAYEFGDADCYNDGDNQKKPGTVPGGWSDGPSGTTPDAIETVAAKYREHDMPGGWILPNDGYGCGYANLPEVVRGLAKHGFKTGLWTENGVDKIAWEVGTAGTRVQKLDVAWTGKGYQFALDANQAAVDGILQNSNSRPMVWTVMGWAGIQRYAVAWTGDQSGSWDYIRWHIPTYIGSGLSAQAYAASDVDGIFGGSPETYVRDLQWKVFTPVLMGMSGWSASERKHPWWFEEPYRSINRRYLKLKNRLIPYMYTYAREAEQTGAPIVRGLMWDHADDPNALSEKYKYQFFLGRDFLVAPVFRSQAASRGWRESVYLPQGRWIDYWDGRVTDADANGRTIDYPVTLDKLPVLVRAGAIIPMYPPALYDGQVPKSVLTLDIYPHGNSSFNLYEDDGNTRDYQQGALSHQQINVSAPSGKAGPITIRIDPIVGQYQGMLPERSYELLVHTRYAPSGVSINGVKLAEAKDEAAREQSATWFYVAAEKFGTLHVRSEVTPSGQALDVRIDAAAPAALVSTPAYPAMPPRSNDIPVDQITVLQRPLEETGRALENAFDGNADTWFRTSRDLSLAYGPHEFVLYFGERKAIDGFDIAPRNDDNWQYGQIKDYEIYVSDINGEWGSPARAGRLQVKQGTQSVRFDPIVGRLLRLRILSVNDPDENADPLVKSAHSADKPIDARVPRKVGNVVVGEFRLHEYVVPQDKLRKQSLADVAWNPVGSASGSVVTAGRGRELHMNGVAFGKGFAFAGDTRIDIALAGWWQTFRADVGIDDQCRLPEGMRFQVWGDQKLLFDSGPVKAPAVVKPEVDIRTVKLLSLRTVGGHASVCGNWANAAILGLGK